MARSLEEAEALGGGTEQEVRGGGGGASVIA